MAHRFIARRGRPARSRQSAKPLRLRHSPRRRACPRADLRISRRVSQAKSRKPYGKRRSYHPPDPCTLPDRRRVAATLRRGRFGHGWRRWRRRNVGPGRSNGADQADVDFRGVLHRDLRDAHPACGTKIIRRVGDRPVRRHGTKSPGARGTSGQRPAASDPFGCAPDPAARRSASDTRRDACGTGNASARSHAGNSTGSASTRRQHRHRAQQLRHTKSAAVPNSWGAASFCIII